MNALAHWAWMGGYAAYVWPAYGVALVVLGGLALATFTGYRASRRALDEIQREGRARR